MKIGLLTQHGKETWLAPLFREHIQAELVRVGGIDTDTLGTFTRDVPRKGTQLEAATRKAELALELSDAKVGMGSEGAFHLDPYLSLLPWNTEMLVLIDRRTRHHIIGIAHGQAQSVSFSARTWQAVQTQLPRAAFPDHHLVVRAGHEDGPVIAKGVRDLQALRAAFEQAGSVHIENDLRAHANPTRQAIIVQAGLDLLRRYKARCPACDAPGWGISRPEPGAPCSECGSPTQTPQGQWWGCAACGQELFVAPPEPVRVDPARCDHCNP